MSKHHRSFWVIPVIAAGLGCGLFAPEKDQTPDPTPPTATIYPPTSEENVLRNLETAHRFKNIDYYDGTLHDDFVFVPNGADPDIDFERLDRVQDRESTLNMFAQVDDIDMNLVFGIPVESDVFGYEGDEYSKVEVTNVTLRVQTREGAAGDPLIYLVEGDVARFIFKRDESATPNTYSIIYQADLGSARLGNPHDIAAASR